MQLIWMDLSSVQNHANQSLGSLIIFFKSVKAHLVTRFSLKGLKMGMGLEMKMEMGLGIWMEMKLGSFVCSCKGIVMSSHYNI